MLGTDLCLSGGESMEAQKRRWEVHPDLVAGGVEGKLVHHRCGYPLWSQVAHYYGQAECDLLADRVSPIDGFRPVVLVSYRDATWAWWPQVVWMCPACGAALQTWWEVSPAEAERLEPYAYHPLDDE
jgi:hypothetical protein